MGSPPKHRFKNKRHGKPVKFIEILHITLGRCQWFEILAYLSENILCHEGAEKISNAITE